MIGDIADRSPGANKHDILNAVGSDSRVGKKYAVFLLQPMCYNSTRLYDSWSHRYLRPGYGFGGPCFPRDNRALGGYAKMVGVQPLLPEATDLYNKLHTSSRAVKSTSNLLSTETSMCSLASATRTLALSTSLKRARSLSLHRHSRVPASALSCATATF